MTTAFVLHSHNLVEAFGRALFPHEQEVVVDVDSKSFDALELPVPPSAARTDAQVIQLPSWASM